MTTRSKFILLSVWMLCVLLSPLAQGQTLTTGALVWDNNPNISLYVVLESPSLELPRRLWNVIGLVTNAPPATNTQIIFPIGFTNRYPDFVGPQRPEFFCLLEWPGNLPGSDRETNWYILQDIIVVTRDAAGWPIGSVNQGHWFYTTNDLTALLIPIAQMPGVTNNDPNFNITRF